MAVFGVHSQAGADAAPPVWRRLFHLTVGSSVPLAGIFASQDAMVVALAVLSGGSLALDLVRFRLPWLNRPTSTTGSIFARAGPSNW